MEEVLREDITRDVAGRDVRLVIQSCGKAKDTARFDGKNGGHVIPTVLCHAINHRRRRVWCKDVLDLATPIKDGKGSDATVLEGSCYILPALPKQR